MTLIRQAGVLEPLEIWQFRFATRGVDPYGTGGHVPQYLWRGTSMVMSPNILEVMSFRMSTRVIATVVCCILIQILCVVSQKSFSFWGTKSPRPPTGDPPRTLLGDFIPQIPSLLLCPPNNPVRSTPLGRNLGCSAFHVSSPIRNAHDTLWGQYVKTWRHPQNRKYMTYRNAVRGRPSHGHAQQKLGEVRLCGFSVMRADRETDRQTDKKA